MQRKPLYAIIAVVAVVAVTSAVLLTRQNNTVPVSNSVAAGSSSAPTATPAPSPASASETNTTEVSDNMFDLAWNAYVTVNWLMAGEEPNEKFSDANTLTDEGRYEAFEIYMGVPEIFLGDTMEDVYATSKYPDIVEQYKAYWAEPENVEKAQSEIEYEASKNNSSTTDDSTTSGNGSGDGDLGYGVVDGTPLNEDGLFADGIPVPGLTDEERSTAEMDQQAENGKHLQGGSSLTD